VTKAKATIEVDDNTKLTQARNKIIELESKLSTAELLEEIRERLIRVENKVDIHNNYEKRIRSLETNQWRMFGIYAVGTSFFTALAIGVVIGIFRYIIK
jgi:hypothetical protein